MFSLLRARRLHRILDKQMDRSTSRPVLRGPWPGSEEGLGSDNARRTERVHQVEDKATPKPPKHRGRRDGLV